MQRNPKDIGGVIFNINSSITNALDAQTNPEIIKILNESKDIIQ